eukprot:gene25021-30224_t
MHFFGSSQEFLRDYRSYVVKAWAGYYFSYDQFKTEYKRLASSHPTDEDISKFDDEILKEIQRVHIFLLSQIDAVNMDLESIFVMTKQNAETKNTQIDRNIEVAIRSVYDEIKKCEEFYSLNYFAISKVGKKVEKLMNKGVDPSPSPPSSSPGLLHSHKVSSGSSIPLPSPPDTSSSSSNHISSVKNVWGTLPAGTFFFYDFAANSQSIENLKRRCVEMYGSRYRKTHAQLSPYELRYIKDKDKNYKSTRIWLGVKFGFILCILLWLVVDSNTVENDFDFWEQPGVYVFTTVGNLLIYRLTWACSIYVWSTFGVNYISVLQLSNIRPNLVMVVNQTASLLLIYFITLLVFFRANMDGSLIHGSFFSYAAPLFLVIGTILYALYENLYLFKSVRVSRGVFTKQVLINCFSAPFVPVSFRDVFAADILTSFTRVISDSLYASCWVVSGAFLTPHDDKDNHEESSATDFGGYMQCTNRNMEFFTGIVQLVPLMIRTLQCLRVCRDQGWKAYPQGYNAFKYILAMVVVFVALGSSDKSLLYTVIVLSTTYKWWWDVVMDWGLMEILPQLGYRHASQAVDNKGSMSERTPDAPSKLFLRKLIMYPSLFAYYFAIFVDLILRFTWTESLVPTKESSEIVGYQLAFFLGSLEILRRGMWAILRVEFEHVKLLSQGKPGFLSTTVLRRYCDQNDESIKYLADATTEVDDNEIRESREVHSTLHAMSESGRRCERDSDDEEKHE